MLHNVLNGMGVGIVVIDADDRIVFFNREAGKMLKEEPEKRMGQSVLLCHPKASEEKVRQFIDDFRKDPQHKFRRQMLNYQGRYLEEDFYSLFDDQGKYLGLVELLYDAEEKVSLLKQLGRFEEPHVSGVGSKAPQGPGTQL
jgi:PAS domain S-box-containing protein